jgi:hypothetical protein
VLGFNDTNNHEMTVFPEHNRLCSIFPTVTIKLAEVTLQCRFSFCLPSIPKPRVVATVDEKFWLTLSPTLVENKPEAPWIKRNADGVVFTDDLQYIDDLDLKSEKTLRNNPDTLDEDFNFEDEINYVKEDVYSNVYNYYLECGVQYV